MQSGRREAVGNRVRVSALSRPPPPATVQSRRVHFNSARSPSTTWPYLPLPAAVFPPASRYHGFPSTSPHPPLTQSKLHVDPFPGSQLPPPTFLPFLLNANLEPLCLPPPSSSPTRSSTPSHTSKMSADKEFTYSDVSEHTSKKDLYIVVDDKVYNCTSFVDEHP